MKFFPENLKLFSVRIENFLDRIHDPPDLKTDWRRCIYIVNNIMFLKMYYPPCTTNDETTIYNQLPCV